MANTKRRLPDREGKMFIPYNIGGAGGDDHFLSGGKLGLLIGILVANILFFMNMAGGSAPWHNKLLVTVAIIIGDIYLIRILVLNERSYYKLYKKLNDYRVTTPSVFWDIVSISEGPDGAQLTYTDLKTAMMVRLERDTITGKTETFKETHYDAISDFYKLLNLNGYSFVQMNMMEQAGNDPRLAKLDELVLKSDNKNVASLMEMQLAYIKSITRATLYESEYFLIYTYDTNKAKYMASEINDILYKILDGGYVGFRIMEAQEIMEFVKEMYGVRLFDPGEAMLNVFSRSGNSLETVFELRSVTYLNGNVQVFELMEEKIQKMKDMKAASKKNRGAGKKNKNTDKDASKLNKSKFNKNKDTLTNSDATSAEDMDDMEISLDTEDVEVVTPENEEVAKDIREVLQGDKKKISDATSDFIDTYGDDLEIDL